MNKTTTIIALCMVCSFTGYSQTESGAVKSNTVVAQKEVITFASQQEKDREIERIEKLIDLRKSQGRTDAQMATHYAELERVKKAAVLTPNTSEQ